jgi:tetratricopeptide (TPR) repeat protein
VADELNSVPESRPGERNADPTAPLVLIPVTAEDVSRRKTRIITICLVIALVIGGISFWMYRRTMDPLNAQQSYDSGVRLFAIARYQQATLSFDRAVKLKADFVDAYLMRGRAYVAEAKPERAIADFTKVIELRPGDPQGFIDRGKAYLDLKDAQSALADGNSVVQLNPKLDKGYNLRGTAARAMGNPAKALEDFNRAVELSPTPPNYYDRGATLQLLGQHRQAIADFDHLIEFNPESPEGYFARAESRRALGDLQGYKEDHSKGRVLDGR